MKWLDRLKIWWMTKIRKKKLSTAHLVETFYMELIGGAYKRAIQHHLKEKGIDTSLENIKLEWKDSNPVKAEYLCNETLKKIKIRLKGESDAV